MSDHKGESSPNPTLPFARPRDYLTSKPAQKIMDAWKLLEAHGRECEKCRSGVEILRAVPDDPRMTDYKVYDTVCETGQELFAPWREAKNEWLAGTEEHRRRQFITDEQLAADGVSFELRGEAIMSMPAKVFQEWLKLPDDVRHARLRALEHGIGHRLLLLETTQDSRGDPWYRWHCVCGADGGAESAQAAREECAYHGGRIREPRQPSMRKCEGCDQENTTHGRFHSRACRMKWESEHGC